ncbi:hypothetical protein [Deinococcus roseus]|uniref:Uncharacterized protein n=1 Tax=Deinococcus roseus TaxID=392414 RepID=A0ABQ2DFE4_9DEIO|nr:hypothetical protein [Deinococcus roseus]GGJ55831.1 hypothetical protein GCM10008938_47510 [Deinococcus roseus]
MPLTLEKRHEQYQEGNRVCILIASALAHSALFTQFLHGTITRTTPKALQIQIDDPHTPNSRVHQKTLWLPRRALIEKEKSTHLAKWFIPDRYTSHLLENLPQSGVSARAF